MSFRKDVRSSLQPEGYYLLFEFPFPQLKVRYFRALECRGICQKASFKSDLPAHLLEYNKKKGILTLTLRRRVF